jgi:hypothetical protein
LDTWWAFEKMLATYATHAKKQALRLEIICNKKVENRNFVNTIIEFEPELLLFVLFL